MTGKGERGRICILATTEERKRESDETITEVGNKGKGYFAAPLIAKEKVPRMTLKKSVEKRGGKLKGERGKLR